MVDSLGMVNAVSGSPSYTGRALRQLSSVRYAGATASRPLGARSGVRPGTPVSTVTATSTTWTMQSFGGLIDEQTAAEAGPYEFAFDAVASGAMTPASASFARVDIIYVQVADPAESDGSTVPAVTRKYLAGTVASTPPAVPVRSFAVAHINVPISGGGSPTITWVAPYCAAAGGVVNFNTKAELNLWTTATNGQIALVLTDGGLWRSVGGAWVAVAGDTGWITATMIAPWVSAAGQTVKYRRLNGVVYFSGRPTGGASAVGFNMSVGFRPLLEIAQSVNNGYAVGTPTRVVVSNTTGDVTLVSGSTPNMSDVTPYPADF